MANASEVYFPSDFKEDLFKWAQEKDVTWIKPEAMLHFLMRKPAVQEFIENAGINFYTLQERIDNAHHSGQESWKETVANDVIRLGHYDRDNPRLDKGDFERISNTIAQIELKNKKPDVIDMFAATIEANIYQLRDGLDNTIKNCGLLDKCKERLEQKGYVDRFRSLKKPSVTPPQPSQSTGSIDMLAALKNPEIQQLLKDIIAAGVQQGLQAREEEQAKGISEGMAQSWKGRV